MRQDDGQAFACTLARMRVIPVACLADNYAYLIVCERSHYAAVVDPGQAEPVLTAAAALDIEVVAVWATHHHPDHVGGVAALRSRQPQLQVVGHVLDQRRISGVTRAVEDGDEVEVGSIRAQIIHNPGHTAGAISYWIAGEADQPGAIFTGDTLFGGGCGRLFEGSAEQMWRSLSRLAELPSTTRVYFGHEYTAANLRFALAVEPQNEAALARATRRREAGASGAGTTPSTMADELATNPFLRCGQPSVISSALAHGAPTDAPATVFAALRRWKDTM